MAEDFEVGAPLPEESSNRTFVIAAVGMGALLVLSMVCLLVYALVLAPRQQTARETQAANIVLQNTEVAATQTAEAAGVSPTLSPTASEVPSPSATFTPTQVIVLPSNTPTPFLTLPTLEPMTATAAAQETLDAEQGGGATPTPTALPTAGFADEAGMPLLVMLGGVLLLVVFIVRGLRTRTAIN